MYHKTERAGRSSTALHIILMLSLSVSIFSADINFSDIQHELLIVETDNGQYLGACVKGKDDVRAVIPAARLFGIRACRIRDLNGHEYKIKGAEISAGGMLGFKIESDGGMKAMSAPFLEDQTIACHMNPDNGTIEAFNMRVFNGTEFNIPDSVPESRRDGILLINQDGHFLGFTRRERDYPVKDWYPLPELMEAPADSILLSDDSWHNLNWRSFLKEGESITGARLQLQQLIEIVDIWAKNPYAMIDLSEDIPAEMESWLRRHNDMMRRVPIIRLRLKDTRGSKKTKENVSGGRLKGFMSENAKRLVNICRSSQKELSDSRKRACPKMAEAAELLARRYEELASGIIELEKEIKEKSPFSF